VTDGNPDREALDAAQNLTKGMKSLADEVKRLRTYGHHNRWFVLVDIGLTVLLTVFGYLSVHADTQARNAAASAAAQHASLISACGSGNQTRAEQVQLWTHLYDQALTTHHLTAAQKAADERLIAYIHHVFAQKNCRAVYSTSGPGR
jgi:hypothetical protein